MKISTKGRYALRIMLDLAMHNNGEYISLTDIAKRQGVSNKYLEQIISKLNKAGFLMTARGFNGGYKLAKAPSEYSVGDILRATEGEIAPIYCVVEGVECEKKEGCRTFEFWKGLDDVINSYIDSENLENLMDDRKK